jgi:hypothetical protein
MIKKFQDVTWNFLEGVFKLFKSAPANAAASCFGEWRMCGGHPLQLAVASQYVEQKQCQLRLLGCAGTDFVNSLAGRPHHYGCYPFATDAIL